MIQQLDTAEIKKMLAENSFGHLGCNDGYNTYVFPLNYIYSGNYIMAHSLPGAKINVMRQNPRVCFETEQIHSATNWKSVMVLGSYQELTDERERYEALKIFTQKNMHPKTSAEFITAAAANSPQQSNHVKPVIFRILIEELTGRYEEF